MKKVIRISIPVLIMLSVWKCIDTSAQANTMKSVQTGFELSGGYGLPDLFNLNVKYGGLNKLGFGVGFLPRNNLLIGEMVTSFGLNYAFHFGVKYKTSDKYTSWYFNTGFSQLFYKEWDPAYFIIPLRIGRSLSTLKSGISLDFGGMFLFDNAVLFMPSFSVSFSRKINKPDKKEL